MGIENLIDERLQPLDEMHPGVKALTHLAAARDAMRAEIRMTNDATEQKHWRAAIQRADDAEAIIEDYIKSF